MSLRDLLAYAEGGGMYTAKTVAVVLMTLLVIGVGGLAAQPARPAGTAAPERPAAAGEMPQVLTFDGDNFTGGHTHIVGDMKRLGKGNNNISSMIILAGTWAFFDDQDFEGNKMTELCPGMYPKVTEKGIKDNGMPSVRLVSPAARAGTR